MIRSEFDSDIVEIVCGNGDLCSFLSREACCKELQLRITFLLNCANSIVKDRECRHYPDLIGLSKWIYKQINNEKLTFEVSHDHKVLPRGLVTHITPGNVALNPIYSWLVSFLAGNRNIVKLPTITPKQLNLFFKHFNNNCENEDFKAFKDHNIFIKINRNSKLLETIFQHSDARVIWGGDVTVSSIKNLKTKIRCLDIVFADRYSICIINSAEYLKHRNKNRLAKLFFIDTLLNDQNACTSPQAIVWIGHEKDCRKGQRLFWHNFEIATEKEKYEFPKGIQLEKFKKWSLLATNRKDLRLKKINDGRLWIVKSDKSFNPLPNTKLLGGMFLEYTLSDLSDLYFLDDPKLQTVTHFGFNTKSLIDEIEFQTFRGIDRIIDIGNSLDFDFHWDGYDLLNMLTRKVKIN